MSVGKFSRPLPRHHEVSLPCAFVHRRVVLTFSISVVREINKINEAELKLGLSGSSWHDEYKDSAYIYVGGLNFELTEGDVITIFSQLSLALLTSRLLVIFLPCHDRYGEVMDVNLPRDKETGKTRGFGFLMYEDQRSTVLAVDNLNGAKVLDKTLRVDHVKGYKQPKSKNEEGEWVEADEQSMNARPEMIVGVWLLLVSACIRTLTRSSFRRGRRRLGFFRFFRRRHRP